MDDIAAIQQKINQAVQLKKNGKFDEAYSIYESLEKQIPNDPTILKSWAKVIALQGDYDRAADMFAKAAAGFNHLNYSEQFEICKSHYINLMNLDKNSEKFKTYLKAIRG